MKVAPLLGIAFLLSLSLVSTAGPLPSGEALAAPVLRNGFTVSSAILSQATQLKIDPATGASIGRGTLSGIADSAFGSRGLGYLALNAASGVDVMVFSNTNSLMSAATILAAQGQSLSTVSLGRVSYHELLLVNTTPQASVTRTADVVTSAVPEPASLALIGAGLAALSVSLRLRRKQTLE